MTVREFPGQSTNTFWKIPNTWTEKHWKGLGKHTTWILRIVSFHKVICWCAYMEVLCVGAGCAFWESLWKSKIKFWPRREGGAANRQEMKRPIFHVDLLYFLPNGNSYFLQIRHSNLVQNILSVSLSETDMENILHTKPLEPGGWVHMEGSRTKARGFVCDRKPSASDGWCSSSTLWSPSPPSCSSWASSPGPWSPPSRPGRSSPTGSLGSGSISPGSILGPR